MQLTIKVKKVVYAASGAVEEEGAAPEQAPQAGAAADGSALHISGPVSSENQYVKMGAFHTLDLEAGRDFTLIKQPGGWDSIGLERVNESTAVAGGAEVGAIVCGEGRFDCLRMARQARLTELLLQGVANVCLITQHTTIVRQRIEVAIPRKRKGGGTALGAERVSSELRLITIYD